MKKQYTILMILAILLVSSGLFAQETKVHVKIEKDGEIVSDTVYTFEDEQGAKHALTMMDVLSGHEMHKLHHEHAYAYSAGKGKKQEIKVFIDEDGEKTIIKEIEGDSLVWTVEDHDMDLDTEEVEVIVIKKQKIQKKQ